MIGELILVEKFVDVCKCDLVNLFEFENFCFMGINVVSGLVMVVVVGIGGMIYFGVLVECVVVSDCSLIVF